MSEVLTYNLFHLAPHEMSHSAFWGWVIQCVDSSAPDRLAEVKQLGERLLKQLRVPPLPPRFNVRTEVLLGKRKGRLDILVTDPSGKRILVIETKISADPDTLQLDKYRAFLGPDVPICLLSTSFDNSAVEGTGYSTVTLNDLVTLFRDLRASDPFLREYSLWLRHLSDNRRAVERDAVSDTPDGRVAALSTPEGQWHLMTEVRRAIASPVGRQYRDTNRPAGTPWTQFSFCEGDADHDALFYRLDGDGTTAKFSLKQYQEHPTPSLDAKHQRLEKLKLWWEESSQGVATHLQVVERVRGKQECPIAQADLGQVPPSAILSGLRSVHPQFVRRLKAAGWPLQG